MKEILTIDYTISGYHEEELIIYSNEQSRLPEIKKVLIDCNIRYRSYGNETFEILYIDMSDIIIKLREDKINSIIDE